MKRNIIIAILIFASSTLLAQKKKDRYAILPTFQVQVDGDLKEWENQLSVIGQDSSWSFAVTNDANYLYTAVQIKNLALQQEAARNGIIVNINPEGKKKDGAILVFPIPDSESVRAMVNDENLPNMNVREELIKRSRGYGVKGFARIVDGRLSFDNTYGVLALAKLMDNDVLVYESKIPIQAIGIKDLKGPIAIQIMINNRFTILQKTIKSRPDPRGSMYGRYSPTVKSPYKTKIDAWVLGRLNKN
ncbi:hypothetical protein SMI01S_00290 [Sphingobacterium mizutaii NBRC 14946 = DSM 11724]|uniref:Uncharacterized protein n=2 Tax=Sphingobacterium mizutaii TaxID=1010 RepID=A0AAJ4XFG0_9SPHI|nr:hypothetical protein [Sphingobacterium mizutaii]GEM66423.1 hypothetical protein SMI01S_00290 [Sphingobacterium mizutaii NBRC 14946 = DSM 11724]SDL54847.1 hypothetical protein SAMN05192578_104343 [Sphingobacterium mizutaii]SNV63825.1 Uncharacterised protein [Sphingobacterium mizutaii]